MVLEIDDDTIDQILQGHPPISVNLGDQKLNSILNASLQQARGNGGRRFYLKWNGSKVPRGAEICGHILAWTQHGRVITDQNQDIGTYDRLIEFGGPSKEEQHMIVYLFPSIA